MPSFRVPDGPDGPARSFASSNLPTAIGTENPQSIGTLDGLEGLTGSKPGPVDTNIDPKSAESQVPSTGPGKNIFGKVLVGTSIAAVSGTGIGLLVSNTDSTRGKFISADKNQNNGALLAVQIPTSAK